MAPSGLWLIQAQDLADAAQKAVAAVRGDRELELFGSKLLRRNMMKSKRVIILFADIHDSTAFGYTQKLEQYNKMLRDFHKTCHQTIKEFRQKNKFGPERVMASCRGDECCVFLSGGQLHEDELLAMKLAIYLKEMWKQSDFCRLNAEAAGTGLIPQVDLRIGIGSGKVALDDDVWSGTETLEGIVISEAKRIEGQADAASKTLIMVKWDIKEACIQAGAKVEFGYPLCLAGKGIPSFHDTPLYPVESYAEWKAIQEEVMPSPATYWEGFSRALALQRSGDVEGAISEYTDLLKLRPDHPDTLSNRGVALGHLGKHEEALGDFNRSLALRPDHPATLNNRGVALGNLGKHEEALRDYNRSLELRPDHPDTLNNRGAALDDLGKHEEALKDYNRSLELRPDHPTPLYNRARLFSLTRRFAEALADLGKAVGADPKYRGMAREDKDFDKLRADPEFGPQFQKLVAEESK